MFFAKKCFSAAHCIPPSQEIREDVKFKEKQSEHLQPHRKVAWLQRVIRG